MKEYDIVIDFIGIFISYIFSLRCYQLLLKNKNKLFKFSTIILIIIAMVFGYLNNKYNFNITRLLIHIVILFTLFFNIFKEGIRHTFIKTITIYLIICFSEIILAFPISFTKLSASEFSSNPILKIMFSTMVMIFTLLFFEIKKTREILIKIYNYLISKGEVLLKIIIAIFLTSIFILAFKASFKLTFDVYTSNLITFILIILLVIFFLIEYFKAKKAEVKESILLDSMSNYEKLIDEDRVNKHEMLNNLILLKSIHKTEKFDETINSLISEYQKKDKIIFSNVYNLPRGLKGILYYKVHEIKNKNIQLYLNLSPKACDLLEKVDTKSFMQLCKIFGNLLDNAKESSENAKIKKIIIDIYQQNKEIIIYMENTFKGEVNIDKIYEKKYSTKKGENRGWGLYIVKKIIENSNIFDLQQYINESSNFVSVLKIKELFPKN